MPHDGDRSPFFIRWSTMYRLVGLLPAPVRTAHTAITGLVDLMAVDRSPGSAKPAPAASLGLARRKHPH